MYRSGRNEADSKSVDGSNRPGVRIPPSPPKSLGNSVFPRLFFFLEWFRDLSDTQNGANGAGLCGAKAIRPMHKK